MQPETSIDLICSVYPSFHLPPSSSKGRAVCASIGTHVQVTEVLVVVQSVAHDKAVGDFKSNICREKRRNTPLEHAEIANVSFTLQEKRRWKQLLLLTVRKTFRHGGDPFHQQAETHRRENNRNVVVGASI